MNLPEHLTVEFIEQFFQWLPDQRLALDRHHARVFSVRLEIEHLINGDELDGVTDGRLYPAQLAFRLCG